MDDILEEESDNDSEGKGKEDRAEGEEEEEGTSMQSVELTDYRQALCRSVKRDTTSTSKEESSKAGSTPRYRTFPFRREKNSVHLFTHYKTYCNITTMHTHNNVI